MKIDAIKTQIVEIPFDKTITTAIHTMRSVGCLLLTIETDEGISGEGYKSLAENQEVTFEIIEGPKGLQATNIS